MFLKPSISPWFMQNSDTDGIVNEGQVIIIAHSRRLYKHTSRNGQETGRAGILYLGELLLLQWIQLSG